jgi:hypothetical protein
MDEERDARYGSGWSQNDPAAERPPWLRQLLGSRRPSQLPVTQNGASPSGKRPIVGPLSPPGRLPGAPSSGVLGRAPSSANLGRRRDVAAEQTAMMDIARTDLVECPRCGAANFDNASRCAECAYVLLISCPRCGLVNRTGTMQCARCGLFLSQPTGAPRIGAYGVAAPVSRPLPSLGAALPRLPVESSPRRPIGRWILTALVALTLFCAFIVALAEGFPPVNDAIASVTHVDIHAMITNFIDFLLSQLPH